MKHANINDIPTYLRRHAEELGNRILESHPPPHAIDDPPSPMISRLLRRPYPAQTLAIMGLVRRWQQARAGAVIAECGTGKTLISLGAVQTHAEDRPLTALAMVPPQLVEKWCRETILTLPRVRVFIIDGLRTLTGSNSHHGVNEVKLRNGRILREGLRTSLNELRLRKTSPSARKRWDSLCHCPAVFVVGRDRAKLGYFWRHAYQVACCGPYQGSVVNSDSGAPVYLGKDGERLLAMDFKKVKLSEMLGQGEATNHARRPLYSALWQADGNKIRRFAPVDFIGRYMDGFFDYAIADEVHELKGGDTAQGNALGTLASSARHIAEGGLRDRVFVSLSAGDPPLALWWLSVQGIWRERECDEGAHLRLLPEEPVEAGAGAVPTGSTECLLHPKYHLPAQCFAYVGDYSKPHSWKLPYLLASGAVDAKRLPKAVQAILSNYRGAKVSGIPEGAIPDVLARLARAARRAGHMPPDACNPAPIYRQLAEALQQLGVTDATGSSPV